MSTAKDLHLLSLLYGAPAEQIEEILTGSGCVALRAALQEQDLLDLLAAPREDLCKAIRSILKLYLQRSQDHRYEQMSVSEPVGALLEEIRTATNNVNDPPLPSLQTVARGLIGQGKLPNDSESTRPVEELIDVLQKFINWGLDTVSDEAVQSPYPLPRLVHVIVFLDDVMVMLNTYLTCKDNPDYSETELIKESLPMSETILLDLPDDAYGNVEEQLDHATTIVDGMEGFLLNDSPRDLSYAQQYVHGVLYANGAIPQMREGNEGKIMDTIKKSAQKVWDTLMSALKAIKDFFFGKADKETQQAALAIADKNKATMAASDDKSAEIKDTAKAGLLKLAEASDESGEFKAAAEGLNTVSDAPSTLDKLKNLMNKQVSSGGNLRKLYEAAEKKVQDLKALISKADSVADDDKEGAAAAKQELQAGMNEAKEALTEAKKEMGLHKKFMNGLRKAMINITMAIFMHGKNVAEEVKEANA
ncbi:hypothetical protein RISINGSUN_73 [Erwinia phage vB_EamM_RisingSun]|uniref:Uncharacterized protein n=1 Tax=Erwinia phage vB_EamM_RisingSun TaxID=2026080 RepID=A0A223LGQ8_9CAUD|nr:hypothetical protein FDI45_gp073 [Erwinia phage vB_EamM_RisingSun]ASU03597.1 hypothetical protein RISINGSUN_73 [Erwinia phage vB_EamM_RisingSun]